MLFAEEDLFASVDPCNVDLWVAVKETTEWEKEAAECGLQLMGNKSTDTRHGAEHSPSQAKCCNSFQWNDK